MSFDPTARLRCVDGTNHSLCLGSFTSYPFVGRKPSCYNSLTPAMMSTTEDVKKRQEFDKQVVKKNKMGKCYTHTVELQPVLFGTGSSTSNLEFRYQ